MAMTTRAKWLARLSGVFLAGDLVVWAHAIAAVGAGLATVLGNLQVLLVAGLAWAALRERPDRSLLVALPVMFAGVALVGGVAGSGTYGAHPARGVVFGIGTSILYAGYILVLRQAMSPQTANAPRGGIGVVRPLYEATLGATGGAAVLALTAGDFRIGGAAAFGWLALLALTSQVIGWLLISLSLPKLPAALTSMLLLVQPVGAIALGAVIFGESPSLDQLGGVGLILCAVVVATAGRPISDSMTKRRRPAPALFRTPDEHDAPLSA
jgi:drug/metabolite transporter (DMT)-like permease